MHLRYDDKIRYDTLQSLMTVNNGQSYLSHLLLFLCMPTWKCQSPQSTSGHILYHQNWSTKYNLLMGCLNFLLIIPVTKIFNCTLLALYQYIILQKNKRYLPISDKLVTGYSHWYLFQALKYRLDS